MKNLNRANVNNDVKSRPVKVLQFGEGNFLRAFVDWMVDVLNEKTDFNGAVQVVQPLPQGMGELLNKQDGLYHVILQGIKDGQPSKQARLIQCVKGVINPYEDLNAFLTTAESEDIKFIVSNTTESGIAFASADESPEVLPQSFPGKVALWLHHRFKFFKGEKTKGVILLPCELIEKNGITLQQTILQYIDHWKLSNDFKNWVLKHNTFCNTLVDRIVPGYPKETIKEIQQELGFDDQLVVTAEPFHLWVIEGPEQVKQFLPAEQTDLQIVFTNDLTPYRSRKVRILNGAHTAMVPVAYLKGLRTVRETMENSELGKFVETTVNHEIIPTLDLPVAELKQFAHDVTERFLNPFIKHELLSISLNSISKFEVRVLPSLVTYYERKGTLPVNLVNSLAALLVFYRGRWKGETIPLSDGPEIIKGFHEAWKNDSPSTVLAFLATVSVAYQTALYSVPGLSQALEKSIFNLLQEEQQLQKANPLTL
jgi:tagaturonate reductase